jgi:hypothetical protein
MVHLAVLVGGTLVLPCIVFIADPRICRKFLRSLIRHFGYDRIIRSLIRYNSADIMMLKPLTILD